MASIGSVRGTPKGLSKIPSYNATAPALPRAAPDSPMPSTASDAGASSMSASRQKQSKRDEVRSVSYMSLEPLSNVLIVGHPQESRNRSQQA